MPHLSLSLIFTAFLTIMAGAAAPWELAKPKVPFSPTPAVCYGAGRWVGVGPAGKIITSTNGVAWTPGPLLTAENLLDVAYADGRFVACGGQGTILTSLNGLQWEHRTCGDPAELRDVCHGAGMWVFSGKHSSYQHPVILSSSDLAIWNRFDTAGKYQTAGNSAEGYTVAFGNGQFLMPMPNSQAFVSGDGIGWTKQTNNLNFSVPQCSIYDSGKFYCLNHWGQFSSSPDGITWTAMQSPADFRERTFSLHVEGSRMIISSEYGFYTSIDGGNSWTKHGVYSNTLSGPGCGGIGKGKGGYVVMAFDGSAIRSKNFVWRTSGYAGADADHFLDVCHGKETFVAVGSLNDNNSTGAIWSSPNGKTWTRRRGEGRNLYAACYGNGTWVCVGDTNGFADAVIVTSRNLKTWTERSNPASGDLRDVIFANGLFVTVGGDYDEAVLLTSPDGVTWTVRDPGLDRPLRKVIHANGVFVVIGVRNSETYQGIASSPDGIHWTPSPIELASGLNCIAYGNSMFLATNANGYRLKSSNGTDWTVLHPGPTESFPYLSDLIHDGTRFVACALSSTRSPAYSVDGMEWSDDLARAPLSAMVAAEGKIVAVGPCHHISQRPIVAVPDGPGSVGAEGSTISWSPVAGAAGYQIYKRLPGEKHWEDAALTQAADATSVTLDGLMEETTYEIAIQAVTAKGLSHPRILSTTTSGP